MILLSKGLLRVSSNTSLKATVLQRTSFMVQCSHLHMLLSHFSRIRLCDPIDGSTPGSAVPGILQARTLERVAISFSNALK